MARTKSCKKASAADALAAAEDAGGEPPDTPVRPTPAGRSQEMLTSPARPVDDETMEPSSWAELSEDDVSSPDEEEALCGHVEEEEGWEGDVQARRAWEQAELAAELDARTHGAGADVRMPSRGASQGG
jgi:hypothetical protein